MKGGFSPPESVLKTAFFRFSSGLATVLLFIGCLAPKAEPIEGDLGAAIEKGIADGTESFDHRLWEGLLQKYARDGGRRFDYSGLKSEEAKLDEYLGALAAVDLSSLPGNELLALFANAYNAYTVKTVLEHISPDGIYQIESIREIPDVFDSDIHRVGGFKLSLNNMEHNILRPVFKDPRLHFAVNCASASCPPIPVHAFQGKSIDQQLEEVTRSVLSSPDYVRVENDKLQITKILDWYGSDFVTEGFIGAEKNLPDFVRKYTSGEVRQWIDSRSSTPSVKFMKYDWRLNRT